MSGEDWNLFLNGMPTAEEMAQASADELSRALEAHGIGAYDVDVAGEDGVSLALSGIRSAETLLTLAIDGPAGPGTLYDRATSSCVTLSELDEDAPDESVDESLDAGWLWVIHPAMSGRVVGWHVHLTLPAADANRLTARLNEIKRGYPV